MLRVTWLLVGSLVAASTLGGCFTIGDDGKCFDFHPTYEVHCSGDRNIVEDRTSCSEDRGVETTPTVVQVCGSDERCSRRPWTDAVCTSTTPSEDHAGEPSDADASTSNGDPDAGVDAAASR